MKLLLALLLCFSAMVAAAEIAGRWLTFDSDSGAKQSIVEIVRSSDDFRGRVVELFTEPGEPADPVCSACAGSQRGKKVRGLEILLLQPGTNGGDYIGKILDPESGRLYKCTVSLSPDGRRLSIRGYVGIPEFGRTVVWERVD